VSLSDFAKKYLGYLLLLFVAALIVRNLITVESLVGFRDIFWGSDTYPGKDFLPLRPYLKEVRLAGYWADRKTPGTDIDVDTKFMYEFQRARFALLPTILDHYHPLEHSYIVIYVQEMTIQEASRRLNAEIVFWVDHNRALLRKL
jgi:hypothetical protein